MASSVICKCGHAKDEHDEYGCTLVGCCRAYRTRLQSAAELEAIVKQTRVLLAEQEKAWHDALMRECGFEVGDYVGDKWQTLGNLVSSENENGRLLWLIQSENDAWRRYIDKIHRIDQDGNPLPNRVGDKK